MGCSLRIKFNCAVWKACKTDLPRINKSTIKLRTFEHNMLSTSNYFEAAVTKENTTPPSVLRIRKQQFNLQTLTKFGQGTQTKQNCNSSNGVGRHFHVGGLKCKCLCKHTTCRRYDIFDFEPSMLFTVVSRTVLIRYVTPAMPESKTGL